MTTSSAMTLSVAGLVAEVDRALHLVEKIVIDHALDQLPRLFRQTSRLRPQWSKSFLQQYFQLKWTMLPEADGTSSLSTIMSFLSRYEEEKMATSGGEGEIQLTKDMIKESKNVLVEMEMYCLLIVISLLIQSKQYSVAIEAANTLVETAIPYNKRTLDAFTAQAYAYLSLGHQKQGTLPSIRNVLLRAHRMACLRHDAIGQATLLNLLLGNYLSENLYEMASKLVSKSNFPENASNNQLVRYLYYVGRIQAIQLEYTESHSKLMQALRKAPQNTALGFRQSVNVFAIIVQLLMGEIPERSTFMQPGLSKALAPYMHLTNAVRIGDLNEFNNVMQNHNARFKQDNAYTLILRLRHNVIKTGLRKISISYSRISFKDICSKLCLDSPENTEYVVAKAISDGVIDAVIDHDHGWMQSKEVVDVYGTNEPQQAFHKRITFCLDVHNEAVKAMRYPPDAYKKELETAEERMEREKQDEELQKEIEGELDEEGM